MATENIKIDIMGVEFDGYVEFDYTPAVKGVYHLAPEDCYPSEPEEFELTWLFANGVNMSALLNNEELCESIIEQIKESE